ncbi:hypothetical protein [Collimonas pratensis]|nr:hypothetical protein [Collimonas pratensis]
MKRNKFGNTKIVQASSDRFGFSWCIEPPLITLTQYLLLGVALLLAHPNIVYAQAIGTQVEPEEKVIVQNSPLKQWGPPYPFTPDELRQKLMQVLRIQENDLSKEKIEGIFEMKMLNSDRLLPESLNDGKWYKVYSNASVDWYFAIGISVIPHGTNFGFRWWNLAHSPDPYTVPMCLDILPLLKDIEGLRLGWIEKMPDPLMKSEHGTNPRHYFNRSKDEWLHVDYLPGTNCLTALAFGVNTTNGN